MKQASTYQYRLKAYTPFAVSAYSNIVTIIQYWIPERSCVELKITDILGREITSLISKDQNAGQYKVQFNDSSLPSGIYIYTIQAGEFRNSKKCIVLK